MDKLEACRAMYADAIERLNLALEDLEKSEIERAGFAMEAKNAKERAALLEQLNGQLEKKVEQLTANYDVAMYTESVNRETFLNLEKDAKTLAKQHENDLLALEAMKEKLKRKNEQIARLKEANKAAMIGVGRMRRKLDNMKRRKDTYDIYIKLLKETIDEQRSADQRLRENCDALYKTIVKFRSAAKELLDVEIGSAET